MVVAEALAAGVPVLATRCGGPEEIVTDEVGRLVRAEDVDALAGGLAWMLDHAAAFPPDRLRAYAERHFGFEAVSRRLLEVYEAVRAGRR